MTHRLASDGGIPVRTKPFPHWPATGAAEIAAVSEVLSSGELNYWTGAQGRMLEREYADSLGRAWGIAVANGTVALELALRAFLIGPGDEVIVPARTFIATASAVIAVGAVPIIADIDPASGNLSAESVAAVISPATKCVIAVHVGGWPVDMDPLISVAREHDLILIEDCAQAHGAMYRDKPAGALGSHAATFSFCQDKIIAAGEGGMIVLDDREAYERAWSYKDHGKSLAKIEGVLSSGSTMFRWVHDEFGSNMRLSEMASAVVRVGLAALPGWHIARTHNAMRLVAGLADVVGLDVPLPEAHTQHAFYRLYGRVVPEAIQPGWDRDSIARAIAEEGIPCQYGTCAEIYREDAFRASESAPREALAVAHAFHETQLAFFVHPTLTDAEIDDTIAAVRKVMSAATR